MSGYFNDPTSFPETREFIFTVSIVHNEHFMNIGIVRKLYVYYSEN